MSSKHTFSQGTSSIRINLPRSEIAGEKTLEIETSIDLVEWNPFTEYPLETEAHSQSLDLLHY